MNIPLLPQNNINHRSNERHEHQNSTKTDRITSPFRRRANDKSNKINNISQEHHSFSLFLLHKWPWSFQKLLFPTFFLSQHLFHTCVSSPTYLGKGGRFSLQKSDKKILFLRIKFLGTSVKAKQTHLFKTYFAAWFHSSPFSRAYGRTSSAAPSCTHI